MRLKGRKLKSVKCTKINIPVLPLTLTVCVPIRRIVVIHLTTLSRVNKKLLKKYNWQ